MTRRWQTVIVRDQFLGHSKVTGLCLTPARHPLLVCPAGQLSKEPHLMLSRYLECIGAPAAVAATGAAP